MNRKKLLAVVGPTASGKSALAVSLAERLDGEIVSCDSMQIYKGFSIATAVPDEEEMRGIAHHLISFADTEKLFSVAEYCELANKCINDITERNKLPVLCGGTGLYYTSLVDGVEFSDIKSDPELRAGLAERCAAEGGEVLLAELAQYDPETAARLMPADHKRIIRAMEVYAATGVPLSEHIRRSRLSQPDWRLCVIGLNFFDREKLYDRINRRVDSMLERGLEEEARRFFAQQRGATAVQAIGYKELKPFFDGCCTLNEVVENLKQSTRRYAKRQLSWFRRDERINWYNVDEFSSAEELTDAVLLRIREELYGTEE